MKLVVVGGVAGGASAAARVRRLDAKAEIIMIERGEHVSFSNCCLPYHLSGTIANSESLVLMNPTKFKKQHNIEARVNSEAIETEENKKPKKSFGPILFDAVFIAMISSFLAVDIAKLFSSKSEAPIDTYVPSVVILVTFLSMALFDLLEKKFKLKWLSSFSLGLSMLIGMTVAVILGW